MTERSETRPEAADQGRMNDEHRRELWRWAVHNRAFDVSRTLGEILSTMRALGGDTMMVFDKWNLADRQLRVCMLEAENLRRALGALELPRTAPAASENTASARSDKP